MWEVPGAAGPAYVGFVSWKCHCPVGGGPLAPAEALVPRKLLRWEGNRVPVAPTTSVQRNPYILIKNPIPPRNEPRSSQTRNCVLRTHSQCNGPGLAPATETLGRALATEDRRARAGGGRVRMRGCSQSCCPLAFSCLPLALSPSCVRDAHPTARPRKDAFERCSAERALRSREELGLRRHPAADATAFDGTASRRDAA